MRFLMRISLLIPAGLNVRDDFVEGVRKFGVPFSMAVGDKDFVMKKSDVENLEAGLRQELVMVRRERGSGT
jgi:hypothetical protein